MVLVSEGVVQWLGVFVVEGVVCLLLAMKMMVVLVVNQGVVEVMVGQVKMEGFLILVVREKCVVNFGRET